MTPSSGLLALWPLSPVYLLGGHGTALLVVVAVSHRVPGVGVARHGRGCRGPVPVVLGRGRCLHVAVVVTVRAQVRALGVFWFGGRPRELARVHARVPRVHQERTHLRTRKIIPRHFFFYCHTAVLKYIYIFSLDIIILGGCCQITRVVSNESGTGCVAADCGGAGVITAHARNGRAPLLAAASLKLRPRVSLGLSLSPGWVWQHCTMGNQVDNTRRFSRGLLYYSWRQAPEAWMCFFMSRSLST